MDHPPLKRLIMGLIVIPLQTRFQNLVVISLTTGSTFGAILVLGTTKSKWFLYIVAYVVTIIHRYYIIVGTLLGVCVGFMNFLLMLIPNFLQEQSEPNHQQAQSTLNNQQVIASVKAIQHSTQPMSFILGAMLVSAIWHHSNQSRKITEILCLYVVFIYWEYLNTTYLLAGILLPIIYAISGRLIKYGFTVSVFYFILLTAPCIGSRLFGAYAGHRMQFIGAGIGGGIVALCSLKFISSINIPAIDDSMTESIECFNENIQDLELIKKGTNDVLHKALTLKHRLIGT